MARGWESKSVEQQQEEMAERRNSIHSSMSADDQQRDRRRQGLLLSRQRLRQQLQTACNPRHREMLEQSLAELESQLASFDQVSDPTAPK
jgi:signal recognition particle GTPase